MKSFKLTFLLLLFFTIFLTSCTKHIATDNATIDNTTADVAEEIESSESSVNEIVDSSESENEVLDESNRSFDYSDYQGYSYHVKYNMDMVVTIDTTEGKPGFVGIKFNTKNSKLTVTNTTSGKKATYVMFTCYPLYKKELFSELPANLNFYTAGAMINPTKLSEINLGDEQYSDDYIYSKNIGFSFTSDNNGMPFEVGETKELVKPRINDDSVYETTVEENYAELFKNISGWAVIIEGSTLNDDTIIQFMGKLNDVNKFGLPYMPVTQ
ncbi:MAG: hypothetical protein LKF42_09700 [Streptococcaceae bacterium]|jgi:hypothetical protein|nr:hypothetical protein [Streptococcaceae bacterium]